MSQIDESTILLGIGDDAAVIQVPDHQQLVQTIDTLIEGKHFPAATDPRLIAWKSLAVNVSDLVAMAATPAFFVLSLTIPDMDDAFLESFAGGLFEAADEFSIRLIGGDTCKGPLSITIQASGLVPQGQYVTRSGAKIGDRIYVSGSLGAAALGLASLQGRIALNHEQKQHCLNALNKPLPQLDIITILRSCASSAIDLSDGLVGDLGHILRQSGVGAEIKKSKLPVFEWITEHDEYEYALAGGDDYRVLFTVPENIVTDMLEKSRNLGIQLTDIGVITVEGFIMNDEAGSTDLSSHKGFDHFATK